MLVYLVALLVLGSVGTDQNRGQTSGWCGSKSGASGAAWLWTWLCINEGTAVLVYASTKVRSSTEGSVESASANKERERLVSWGAGVRVEVRVIEAEIAHSQTLRGVWWTTIACQDSENERFSYKKARSREG